MNLFEKIFNYQIIARLDEAGSFALTSQERTWLKTMLEHPASNDAFAPGTLSTLRQLLQAEASTGIREIIMEKAKSRERQVYHPLLRSLRRTIMLNRGIRLSYRIKGGGVKAGQSGLPYKLEYNMVKREWYLQWFCTRNRSLMSTKLQNIMDAEETALPEERVAELRERLERLLDQRRETAVIQVVPSYNAELSRILYAFSCFEKSVSYDDASDTYRIHVAYPSDESEFLLSKIRFLGLRVRIEECGRLRSRMSESAAKALARYGLRSINE